MSKTASEYLPEALEMLIGSLRFRLNKFRLTAECAHWASKARDVRAW
jgi:hypothetical protein